MRIPATLLAFVCLWTGPALAQTPVSGDQAPPNPPTWSFTARHTLRIETWQFFEPRPGGGDPDYAFLGNRILVQARRTAPRLDITLAAQHVGLLGLPDRASGPGALGTGALYYAQGGQHTTVGRLYPRYAHIRLKGLAPGLDVQVGRQAYTSGAEASSGVPKIEAVKRQRVDARLVGEFEWSLYQRGFDGVRIEWSRPEMHLTAGAFMPTQGGFARESETTMTDLVVAGVTLDVAPSRARPNTALQAFVWRYGDARRVTGRPDNTGRVAGRADVSVTTVGGSLIGAYPVAGGQLDVLGWIAAQTGGWYDHDHGAVSVAAEAGYQWTAKPWAPWLRAGFNHASGDDDPADGNHGTFFPMLPTMRRFSQTTVNSTMNLDDLFVTAILRPRPALNLRVDWQRLWLASAADRWYAGSGATLATGGNFGYVSRPSNGSTDFGSSLEMSAAYTINKYWSVNGFAGRMWGGPVVTGTFAGSSLWFVYIESGLRVDW